MLRLLPESVFTEEGPTGSWFPLHSVSSLLAPGLSTDNTTSSPQSVQVILLITPSKMRSPLLLPRAG